MVTVFYLRQCAFGGTLADCVDQKLFIIFWAPFQTLMLLGMLSGLALLLVLIHPLLAGLIVGGLGSQCACYSYLRIIQKAQAKAAPADE